MKDLSRVSRIALLVPTLVCAACVKKQQEIIDQLHGLYFGERTLKTGLPVSGFVFYPEGTYVGIRAIVAAQATGTVKEVSGQMIAKP